MQSSTQWTDTYLIDDRGDRHTRAIGFFLNIDGEKRVDMDVPYGQSTRFVFVFNDVPAKVSQVSLHSSSGGLNVENIPVPDPNAASTATTSSNPAPAAGAAPSSSAKSSPGASKTKPGKTTGAATP
jgi:hypothetical protein